MPYFAPPNKDEISAIPSPTNAEHNAGLGRLWDMITGLFGTTGKPAEAFAAMKLLDPKAIYNLAPTFAVGSNALTITLKDKDGVDLGTNNPGFVGQRHATLSNGGFAPRKLEANISLVISAGSTLGHTANVLHPLYLYAIDNAGTQELAVTSTNYGEVAIVSTTAEGGAGAADSASTIYSATARANVPARLLALAWLKQSTPGNWVNLPTCVQRPPLGLSVQGEIDALKRLPSGLETANKASDPDHDIDVQPGVILDDQGIDLMVLPAAITKLFDASWAVGNNAGGLDGTEAVAGTPDASSWLYLWLIKRSDTGVVDVIGSTSSSAPSLPANYDRKRLIWRVWIDGSNNIEPYEQDGDWYYWSPRKNVLSAGGATGSTAVSLTGAVPSDAPLFKVVGECHLTVATSNVYTTNHLIIRVAVGVDYDTLHNIEIGSGNFNNGGRLRTKGGQFTYPNTGTFEYRNSGANQQARDSSIWITGFKVPR